MEKTVPAFNIHHNVVWYLPIELLEERYTKQMYQWVLDGSARMGITMQPVHGKSISSSVSQGEVLDAIGTNYYKATQLTALCALFQHGVVKNGDAFFIGDLWFPGIEMIRYITAQIGMQVRVGGVHYAGVFDPHDFTHKMYHWGRHSETGWLTMADAVFVGSDWHRNILIESTGLPHIYTTGLVWDVDAVAMTKNERPPRVIFPHRLDKEKAPEVFFSVAERVHRIDPTIEFVITSSRKEFASNIAGLKIPPFIEVKFGLTKEQYYEELRNARVLFSSALQETFGYALQEGLAAGCTPVVPARLSYVEMVHSRHLYENEDDAVEKVIRFVAMPDPPAIMRHYAERFSHNVDTMLHILTGD
jgi:glycosyltransferase involved in cell wall biosynthesis